MLGKHFLRKEKKYLFTFNILLNKNSSNVLHTWEFALKGTPHKVELWDSRLSGKKKLAVDDEVIVQKNNSIAVFNYSFQLDSYYFNLVQLSDSEYDLKINDIFFKDIMIAEESGELKINTKNINKSKEEYDDEDESNELNNQSKKHNDYINNYDKNDNDNDLID